MTYLADNLTPAPPPQPHANGRARSDWGASTRLDPIWTTFDDEPDPIAAMRGLAWGAIGGALLWLAVVAGVLAFLWWRHS